MLVRRGSVRRGSVRRGSVRRRSVRTGLGFVEALVCPGFRAPHRAELLKPRSRFRHRAGSRSRLMLG